MSWIDKDGYIIIRTSKSRKKVREHRHVMEKKLGRQLKKDEIVHHKDGDKTNNKPSNLQLVNGHSKHRKMHPLTKEQIKRLKTMNKGRKQSKEWVSKRINYNRERDDLGRFV